MTNEFISGLKSLLSQPRKVVLIPHYNPDGDAMGSVLGMQFYLNKLGHSTDVVLPNDCPELLLWMPGMDKVLNYYHHRQKSVKSIGDAEIIFAMDFNSLDRIDRLSPLVKKSNAKIVMIDHHTNPGDFACLRYSDSNQASTCEMVYRVIEALGGLPIDKDIAQCLYTGILTDTGSFSYPLTSASTHMIVHNLLKYDIDSFQIHQNLFNQHSQDRVLLLGKALSSLKRVDQLPVAYIALTKRDLNYYSSRKGDTNGFVNYGLTIADIELSVLFIEDPKNSKIKISFRSKNNFPTNKFASEYFNGGGHINASGGYYDGSLNDAIQKFIIAIKLFPHEFQ
ncbi:MAG: bifunctional oligoribonuclease/PAP phosphatase NrnA [Flavobacteriaceae bacterium]|nr:bifunctional oligoribonuclease/PAP phosphatase NrnA [Flavobacteriaceae bacterium]